jgi:cAMP-dependent protein kinase regulator
MFGSVDEKDMHIVIDAMQEKPVTKGTCVIKQGDDGDHLYVVESGTLTCTKLFAGDKEDKVLK